MPRLFPSSARPTSPWQARRADADYGRSAEPNWRGVDWLSHLHQAVIDGRQVNYVDIGDGAGEPVILIHGLSGQWQNWLENIPRLSEERRVIAVDLPGFGLSEMPPRDISITGYGRTVEALCSQLDLGRVAVVGNSMGGFVSAEVAIQKPERVARLMLVSAAGITTNNLYQAPAAVLGRVLAAAFAQTPPARNRAAARRKLSRHLSLAIAARHPSRLAPDFAWEGLLKGTGKPGFEQALRACLSYNFEDRLPEIGCPTLIVWGEDDAILPVRDAAVFERLIPDSRKLVMRDTGHVAMAERPEAFNRVLLDFLAETGAAEANEPADGESQAA